MEREIFCELLFFDLKLLMEFVNNHNIKVISIFPNTYSVTKPMGSKEFKCQEYVLIYSYNI